jgi:hypothetical protein
MSKTFRNEEKYAQKRKSEKSKLTKKYRSFKRGETGPAEVKCQWVREQTPLGLPRGARPIESEPFQDQILKEVA